MRFVKTGSFALPKHVDDGDLPEEWEDAEVLCRERK